MKIKLNNNTELTAIVVNGGSKYHQNANRDTLEFVFSKASYPFEDLDILFADESKTSKMVVIDDTNADSQSEYTYDDYTMRVSMELKPIVIIESTTDAPATTEERVTVTMAQLTYVEKQLQQLRISL